MRALLLLSLFSLISIGSSCAKDGSDAGPAPADLGLPYAVGNLDLVHGGSHPFGIVRSSLDGPGHPGIDLQPATGAEIIAMADGKIFKVESDPRFPGYAVVRLQVGDTMWGIEYESLVPDAFVAEGVAVTKGQRLGQFDGGFGQNPASIHVDLRPYESLSDAYGGQAVCWLDNLAEADRTALVAAWDAVKNGAEFQTTWDTAQMEGKYFLKGLLDTGTYPDGPEICYPAGTDVRQ